MSLAPSEARSVLWRSTTSLISSSFIDETSRRRLPARWRIESSTSGVHVLALDSRDLIAALDEAAWCNATTTTSRQRCDVTLIFDNFHSLRSLRLSLPTDNLYIMHWPLATSSECRWSFIFIKYKPVVELARMLLSFTQPYCQPTWWLSCMIAPNDTLSNLLISRRRCGLAYYLLNIWEFVYFVCGISPPKLCVVRRRNYAQRHVTTMCIAQDMC